MKPDEKDVVVERLLEGLEPSLPPPDLRPKVLAAARVRMAAEPVIDVWSVIWENRGVRLAWAGAVALLLAGKGLRTKIPFGPFLAFGAILYIFFGKELIEWYFSMLTFNRL